MSASHEDPRFARIRLLIGPERLARLTASHVAVVGLGAVGSYAVEGLARAGVGRLRLVDFDVVQPSNINRQLYAMESTLGRPKAELAAARVRDINPACQVETLRTFVHVESMDNVLAGPPDVVVDAIDSLLPKTELLLAAGAREIPIVSSMGAALRTDPSHIRVGRLSRSRGCPLARQVRKHLRRRGGRTDLLCVYSDEPNAFLRERAIAPEEESTGDEYPRGRKRRDLGSLPTITGIVGLTVANTVLEILLGGGWAD